MPTNTYISDEDALFIGGVRSDIDPGSVPRGFVFDMVNATMVGGAISCRPGKEFVANLPDGRFQGASFFYPTNSLVQIVAVVSGAVYLAKYPFTNFVRVAPDTQLSPDVREVFFANAQQAVYRETDELDSLIIFRQVTINVLIIQDGGKSGGLSWDGASITQHKGNTYGMMSGGPMAWVGDRLWVARGKELGASDIVDPFSFREQVYLGGTARFAFPEDVVAMASIPGLSDSPLLVWTRSECYVVLANVRQRDQWVATAGFVRILAPIGATSSRGVVSHGGQIFWMTPSGVVRLDSAIASQSTSKIPIVDGAMLHHKMGMPGDLSRVCGVSFGEYMLLTIPDVSTSSTRTWVWRDPAAGDLDQTEKWLGVWTGTNPVAWLAGDVNGIKQVFEFSEDEGTQQTRLWRNFSEKRLDDGAPIFWGVRTRGFFGPSSGIEKGASAKLRMVFAKVGLVAIEEDLDIAVYFAGTRRGSFKSILLRRYVVPRGSVHFDIDLDETVDMLPLKAQAREAVTSDASETEFTGLCDQEDQSLEDVDDAFWLYVCAHGPATIKWIRVFGDPVAESLTPSHLAFTNEIDPADGVAATGDAVDRQLLDSPEDTFTAGIMAQVAEGGVVGTGIGQATSTISQLAADRVARVRAVTAAGRDYSQKAGPFYSNLVSAPIP